LTIVFGLARRPIQGWRNTRGDYRPK